MYNCHIVGPYKSSGYFIDDNPAVLLTYVSYLYNGHDALRRDDIVGHNDPIVALVKRYTRLYYLDRV